MCASTLRLTRFRMPRDSRTVIGILSEKCRPRRPRKAVVSSLSGSFKISLKLARQFRKGLPHLALVYKLSGGLSSIKLRQSFFQLSTAREVHFFRWIRIRLHACLVYGFSLMRNHHDCYSPDSPRGIPVQRSYPASGRAGLEPKNTYGKLDNRELHHAASETYSTTREH